MIFDPRLYLVTDPAYDELADLVAAAVAGGVTCVQVRDKLADSTMRTTFVRTLRQRLPRSVAVLSNDDVDAARAGDGLHVGVDDLAPSRARSLLGPDAIIGWSINAAGQLDDAAELAACDYVAVSPVWSTPTKTDTGAPFGIEGTRTLAARLGGRMPLVAIGGIHAGNAGEVIAAGADGIALVSAICAAADPGAAAARLRMIVDDGLDARRRSR